MFVAGAVSAALIAFELALLRLVLVASWHHFAFLVISVALLGFGASGTALTVARRRIAGREAGVLLWLVAATAVAIPVCAVLVQRVPLEARLVPVLVQRQLGTWLLFWALATVPFLAGASAVGLTLIMARDRAGEVYGANLIGSALGGVAATLGMYVLPSAWLAPLAGALALPAVLGVPGVPARRRWATATVAAALLGGWVLLVPPRARTDPFKAGAYMEQLVAQGSAAQIAAARSPRGEVAVYRSAAFHDVPFLSGGERPPASHAIVIDGHHVGSLLRIGAVEQARVLERTLMAVPYWLLPLEPRVALLGEVGGANVWLALLGAAQSVHVVQPDPALWDLLRGPLRGEGGAVFSEPRVRLHTSSPRRFVDRAQGSELDLVQLVSLESTAASGGLAGLGEDHLVTVEGIAACLNLLSVQGILSVARAIQSPPRDNLKLLATIAAALRRRGVADPGRYVIQLRDYLGVVTMVRARPWLPSEVARVRRLAAHLELTPVWYPGIRPGELNRPDALPAPPGEVGDWFHHGARQLLGDEARAAAFVSRWAFDLRPPRDDRPFFRDLCRLGSLAALREAYGQSWLAQGEVAFLFVLFALGVIGVAGATLTLLPLVWIAELRGRPSGLGATCGMFAAIGLAYMLLELTLLARFTRLIGDPVLAASLTITVLLLASGLGSLDAQRWSDLHPVARRATWALVGLAGLLLLLVPRLVEVAAPLPFVGRAAVLVLITLPLGYLMGFPLPLGLARLDRRAAPLIPWAWGINGFASVLAPPLATVIGMAWGFHVAGGLAVLLYLAAAFLLCRLP